MDPVTLILTALAAGASASLQATSDQAIKDAYNGLKTLILRKFAGKPEAEIALSQHETDPDTWEKPLKKALTETQVDQDKEVLSSAQHLTDLIQQELHACGGTATASGNRAVAFEESVNRGTVSSGDNSGNISDSTIISGNNNVLQHGQHNIYWGSSASRSESSSSKKKQH